MGVTDYLKHFLLALFLSSAYFIVQVDFSKKLKKQRGLFAISFAVFAVTLALAYFLIQKPKNKVTFGENEVEEFDDGDDDDYENYPPAPPLIPSSSAPFTPVSQPLGQSPPLLPPSIPL